MVERSITLSVVSHRQNTLVNALLQDLQCACRDRVSVVLTENVPDSVALSLAGLDFPVRVIRNRRTRGFAANHNAAFRYCDTPYFCVCNPDVHLPADPFPPLLEALTNPAVGAAGPLVLTPDGRLEDSARPFPRPAILARKLLVHLTGRGRENTDTRTTSEQSPDWIAGMFMVFRRETFAAVRGFDEGYHLYYEDVDLCARLRLLGMQVVRVESSRIVHDARRASHRNLRHALWHIHSILRYLRSDTYARLRRRGLL